MKQIIILLCILLTTAVYADSYWVGLTDKIGTTGQIDHPEEYLTARALQRRQKQHIAIDSADLPLSRIYTDSIEVLGGKILFASRWLNGVTIDCSAAVADQLKQLGFVDTVQLTRYDAIPTKKSFKRQTANDIPQERLLTDEARTQTEQIQLHKLHNLGFRGAGMLISIIDDGFLNVNTLSAFSGVQNQILGTKNFQGSTSVYNISGANHGTYCLSTIAAQLSDYTGAATEAEYYLMSTEEDDYENFREMDALVAAMELADSVGSDIISVSLGYLDYFDNDDMRLSYSQMDGRTCRSSIAATIAARKGMIVCAAQGNEGNDDWKYLDTPADADSILAVGSVSSVGKVSVFSSYGPTADGRVKPDICTMGEGTAVVNAYTDYVIRGSGTSFATPIAAGMVACLWQALPHLNNIELMNEIRRTASKSSSPDDRYGYGIANAYAVYQQNQQPTDIKHISATAQDVQFYDILGRYIGNVRPTQRGMYIMRSATHSEILSIQ